VSHADGNILNKAFNNQIDLVISLPANEVAGFMARFKQY
jgi:hypothetical protein